MRVVRTAAPLVLVLALAASAQASTGTYTVRWGDTLSGIAARLHLSVANLAAANGINDPDHLLAGTSIRVSGTSPGSGPTAGATSYKVQKGDNLTTIAARLGVTVAQLLAANPLRNANHVEAGTTLHVPASAASSLATPGLPAKLLASPSRLALRPSFRHWAAVYGVPADLLESMTWYESGWQNNKVSSTSALGVGQLMPDTVTFVNDQLGTHLNPAVPDDNIRMSAKFLSVLLHATGNRADQALAAYYQGLAALRARGMYDDTKAYVAGILAWRPHFSPG